VKLLPAMLWIILVGVWPSLALAQRAADFEVVNVQFVKPAESLKQVSKAIRLTLVDRGEWTLDKETRTSIQATLVRRDETSWVTILITFDTSKASIAYVDSNKVAEAPKINSRPSKDSVRLRYRAWVANLAKEIPPNLQRVQILSE
jgi:hypothetical protein